MTTKSAAARERSTELDASGPEHIDRLRKRRGPRRRRARPRRRSCPASFAPARQSAPDVVERPERERERESAAQGTANGLAPARRAQRGRRALVDDREPPHERDSRGARLARERLTSSRSVDPGEPQELRSARSGVASTAVASATQNGALDVRRRSITELGHRLDRAAYGPGRVEAARADVFAAHRRREADPRSTPVRGRARCAGVVERPGTGGQVEARTTRASGARLGRATPRAACSRSGSGSPPRCTTIGCTSAISSSARCHVNRPARLSVPMMRCSATGRGDAESIAGSSQHGVDRVRGAGAITAPGRSCTNRRARRRARARASPAGRWPGREAAARLVGRRRGGHERDALELERVLRRARRVQMALDGRGRTSPPSSPNRSAPPPALTSPPRRSRPTSGRGRSREAVTGCLPPGVETSRRRVDVESAFGHERYGGLPTARPRERAILGQDWTSVHLPAIIFDRLGRGPDGRLYPSPSPPFALTQPMKRSLVVSTLALTVLASCTSTSRDINKHWEEESLVPRVGRFFLGYDSEKDGDYRDFSWRRRQAINKTMVRHFLNINPDNPNHADVPRLRSTRPVASPGTEPRLLLVPGRGHHRHPDRRPDRHVRRGRLRLSSVAASSAPPARWPRSFRRSRTTIVEPITAGPARAVAKRAAQAAQDLRRQRATSPSLRVALRLDRSPAEPIDDFASTSAVIDRFAR